MVLFVQKGLISRSEATEAIDAVIEVKREIAGTRESVVVSMTSIGLLRVVAQSIAATETSEPSIAV